MKTANLDMADLSSEQLNELKSFEKGFIEKTDLEGVVLIAVKGEFADK
jgi:hypothetical protein